MTISDTGTGPDGQDVADPTAARLPHPDGDTRFFGHPIGLGYLAGTELWERFSFYGMQALLMLYMTKHLLTPAVAPHVVGLATFRRIVGGAAITDTAFAAQVFGLYGGLMLMAPLLGAWLGDRVLGRTRTVTIGALLMAAGHLAMAAEPLFLAALALLILGGGCLIGNLIAQIGSLYAPEDSRRARAFGVYLIALNIGALLAPLVVGTLGERVAWHWGFGVAGLGMIVALVTYLAGRRHLPPDRPARRSGERVRLGRARLGRAEWVTVAALVATFTPRILANAAAQQAYGIMVVWADTNVDPTVRGFALPVTWVLTADGILTVVGVLVANRLWARMAARGREPGDVRKLGIGNLMVAAAFVGIGAVAGLGRVPLLAWLGFYLLLDLSYAWWDPPGKALISRWAPASINGTMFAVSSASSATGWLLLGWLGRFYEPLGPARYFVAIAMLPVVSGVAMIVLARPLMRLLGTAERAAA